MSTNDPHTPHPIQLLLEETPHFETLRGYSGREAAAIGCVAVLLTGKSVGEFIGDCFAAGVLLAEDAGDDGLRWTFQVAAAFRGMRVESSGPSSLLIYFPGVAFVPHSF